VAKEFGKKFQGGNSVVKDKRGWITTKTIAKLFFILVLDCGRGNKNVCEDYENRGVV
jgi:hypothetical protein